MGINLSDSQKIEYASNMASILVELRKEAKISQSELANLIGMSRQNYNNIERGKAPLSWGTYLSLLFYFDNNAQTHSALRSSNAFPHEFVYELRAGTDSSTFVMNKLSNIPNDILMSLDDAAWHSLETVVMLEYARCKNISGDAIIKSFNGKNFVNPNAKKAEVSESLQRIKARNDHGKK